MKMIPSPLTTFAWNGTIPPLQRVHLQFERPFVSDIASAVNQAIDSLDGTLPNLEVG